MRIAGSLHLPRWLRWLSLAAGILCLALLIVAWQLSPESAGLGTHQQLGLPPCTVVAMWGIRCPACGMTTSWSWLTKGYLQNAAIANAGGTLLAIIALVYVPASCYFFFVGKATKGQWFSMAMAISLGIAMLATFCQWGMRILQS